MKKSDINPIPLFFDRYINLVDDIELIKGLEQTLDLFDKDLSLLKSIENKRYAAEKWTTKDVIQHIIDNERIQSYRALCFSRNDKTKLPGYDEVLYACNTNTENISIEDLIAEFKYLRQSNILFFKNCTPEMLQQTGECYQVTISVLALGFVLIGHQIHHYNVLKERYFSLV